MPKRGSSDIRRGPRDPGGDELYGPRLGVGAQVGNYVVESLRSRGGFAAVYRARHLKLGRLAALKLLDLALSASPQTVTRFQQEALAVNLIRHPNIVDIFEFGELTDGRPYYVMEWLDGPSLQDELRARGAMSTTEALAVVEDLGAALNAAHRAGVIHRDLKASNVMLVPAGGWYHVKLVDFGIAKLLDSGGSRADGGETGSRLGTPWNMAPEQILGRTTDERTDVYALGVLLYQMLTGELPFLADSAVEVEQMHLKTPPPCASHRAAVGPAVDALIQRCLEKDVDSRYRNVEAMLHDARHALAERAAAKPVVTTSPAVAIHIEVDLDTERQPVDAAVLQDLDFLLGEARRALAQAGLLPAAAETNALLSVAPLPDDGAAARALRQHALDSALALRSLLASREGAQPGVGFTIAVHVASLIRVEADGTRFVGGDLLRVAEWVGDYDPHAVLASAAVLAELEDDYSVDALASGSYRVLGAIAPEDATPAAVESSEAEGLRVLVLRDGHLSEHALPRSGKVTVGRSDKADLFVDDSLLSRIHLVLHVGDTLSVEDLGSANGTSLRNAKVASYERVDFQPDEPLVIGRTTLIVKRGAPRSATVRVSSHELFETRLREACGRASKDRSSFAIVWVHVADPSASGERATQILARLLGPEDTLARYGVGRYELLLVRGEASLPEIQLQLVGEGIASRIAVARYPGDGKTPATLMAALAARIGRGRPPSPRS
jgi:serine/threonine-protein kinase